MAQRKSSGTVWGIGLLGILAGGAVGFLLRPTNALGIRAPFMAVMTRGAGLEGLNALMKPLAVTSFNYVLAGAIIGLAAGALVGYMVGRK